jgi:hypothetical protein
VSSEESARELKQLRESGSIDQNVLREAERHPVLAETLVRLHRVEGETRSQSDVLKELREIAKLQSIALFGNKDLQQPGLVKDMRDTRIILYRGIWTISGAFSFGGILIALAGLWLEWEKH